MAKLFMAAAVIVLTAFISPYRTDRERMREMLEHCDFIDIYCDAPIEVCETRDVNGLDKQTRAGEIAAFTGILSPYQVPEHPETTVYTGTASLDVCVQQVIGEITNRGVCALQLDPMLESETPLTTYHSPLPRI